MAIDWKQKYGITPVENPVENVDNAPSAEGANLEIPKSDWKTKYGIVSQPITVQQQSEQAKKTQENIFLKAGAFIQ